MVTKSQLLRSISMTIPGTDQPCELLEVPAKISAVYFLMLEGRVIYVGKTKNLVDGVWSHECGKVFDEVRYIPCHHTELTLLEDEWLVRLRPELNGAGSFVQSSRRLKLAAEVLQVD